MVNLACGANEIAAQTRLGPSAILNRERKKRRARLFPLHDLVGGSCRRLQGNQSMPQAVTLQLFDWITLAPGVIRL